MAGGSCRRNCLAIVSFVALAYYIGGKRVLRENLSDALRDDTMT